MQNLDWSSQAELTLDSQPKCFVGWLKNNLPACDFVDNIGDWCNCSSSWDGSVTPFQWQNTNYSILAWNPSKFMINVNPATPLLTQVFFNCKRTAFPYGMTVRESKSRRG